MELHHLRYLVVLAEERHFTRAARRLGIAQPALSQQIRRLETIVGMPLVERTTRSVAITAAGELLVAGARRVLREVDGLRDELDAVRGLRQGRVLLGVTQTPGAVDVARTLARFHARHPEIELDVREGLSVRLASALEAGELDLALVTLPGGPAFPALEVTPLAAEELTLVVPPGHPLASRRSVTVGDLRDEPLVAFPRGATIRDLLDARAGAAGLVLRVSFETVDPHRTRELVAAGLALGLLPRSDALRPGPEVALVPFAEELEHRTAVAVRRDRRLAPGPQAFLAMLREGALPA